MVQLPFKALWLSDLYQKGYLTPYIFMRKENLIKNPGSLHPIEWFDFKNILYLDALNLEEKFFGEGIIYLENKTFGPELAMPRWVFWDCAVIPGFISGFAMKMDYLPQSIIEILGEKEVKQFGAWMPISLFIIIPTIHKGEWVAHNLCTINTLLPESERFYGLGFLTKAFGLWYANVEACIGMTQWIKPALKLHSHFGYLQVLTAYSPLHTYASTMTYRCEVDTRIWRMFFSRVEDTEFLKQFRQTHFIIDPVQETSMIQAQKMIDANKTQFYLNPSEIALRKPLDYYTLYEKII